MSVDGEYSVSFNPFSDKHFCKKFAKKYKTHWIVTQKALKIELSRPDVILSRSMGDIIAEKGNIQICKIEFRVAGTKESRKASGNRCIIVVDRALKAVQIVLVYHKNDLPKSGGETTNWKNLVKENFDDLSELL